MTAEKLVRIETVRIPRTRDTFGSCLELANSIRDEGLRHPITIWQDGTLISGGRRLRASLLHRQERIPAVFVNTIEDAAKRMLVDSQDDQLALPWKPSEMCRMWQVLRRLDAPAAAQRLDAARRRGVEARRLTQAGKRPPGRSNNSDDYVLGLIAEPFGISATSAYRIEAVHRIAYGEAPDERREMAGKVMAELDDGGNIYANYRRLMGARPAPVSRPRPVAPTESAPAAKQVAAWDKALPQMEGLVTGLVELGPPSPDLTWDQVGSSRTRLMAVRREMEKIIRQMKEINKS